MQDQMVVQYVQPRTNVYLFRTGNQFLTTTELTPLQLELVTYILVALGIAIIGSIALVRCAAAQNVPMFMTQQVIDDLKNYRVEYGIIIHNRHQDTYPDHATAFIEWTSRFNRDLTANVHLYPSQSMFDRGIIENALLNNLPRSTLGLYESNNHFIHWPEILQHSTISPLLKFINRNSGQTLKFYIKHLFEDRLLTDWLTADSTHLGSDIIDVRGLLLRKVSNNTLDLFSFDDSGITPYNIPDALERFIDIINETWMPVLL